MPRPCAIRPRDNLGFGVQRSSRGLYARPADRAGSCPRLARARSELTALVADLEAPGSGPNHRRDTHFGSFPRDRPEVSEIDGDGTLLPAETFLHPWVTVAEGVTGTPAGGTLWIQPGHYGENLTLDRDMAIRAPLGGVTLGQ
jgi:hypothetical protein